MPPLLLLLLEPFAPIVARPYPRPPIWSFGLKGLRKGTETTTMTTPKYQQRKPRPLPRDPSKKQKRSRNSSTDATTAQKTTHREVDLYRSGDGET